MGSALQGKIWLSWREDSFDKNNLDRFVSPKGVSLFSKESKFFPFTVEPSLEGRKSNFDTIIPVPLLDLKFWKVSPPTPLSTCFIKFQKVVYSEVNLQSFVIIQCKTFDVTF